MQIHFNSQTLPQQRISGRVQVKVLAVSIIAIVFVIGFMRWASPERQIENKQAALIRGVEKRSRSKVEKLIADSYLDRWMFDKEDAITAFLDVGSQFIALGITEVDPEHQIDESRSTATVTTQIKVAGSGSPVAQMILRRTNQLEAPFVFTWEKQSWWPGSWRLTKVDNSELPESFDGYQPGDIRRAMSMEP